MKINNIEVTAKEFAFDGCHKIYTIDSQEDRDKAIECGYEIFPIEKIQEAYENSCPLKFIHSWRIVNNRCVKDYVPQFETATFVPS